MKSNTNNNWKFEFGFVTTGKYSDAYIEYLRKKYPELLAKTLVVAPRETSDLSKYEQKTFKKKGQEGKDSFSYVDLGLTVSTSYEDLKDAHYIIPMVTPGGVGNVLLSLQTMLPLQPQQLVVFISSGVSFGLLEKYLPTLPKQKVAIATGNSNVRYGLGCCAYAASDDSDVIFEVEDFFKLFGSVERESEEMLLSTISTYGADNGLNAGAIKLFYKEEHDTQHNFQYWLIDLENFLVGRTTNLSLRAKEVITKHLNIKTNILAQRPGYTTDSAKERVSKSFASTVAALIAMGADSFQHINEFIAWVATKDGNTEKGLKKLTSVKVLLTEQTVDGVPGYDGVIGEVYAFAETFPQTAAQATEKAYSNDGGRKVLSALAKGDYLF